jgi:hypothetical protein
MSARNQEMRRFAAPQVRTAGLWFPKWTRFSSQPGCLSGGTWRPVFWKTSGFSDTVNNKAKAGFDTAAMNLIFEKKGNFRVQ